MSSFIRNIDRDINPCNGTVTTTVNIVGSIGEGNSFVSQLIDLCNMHQDLDRVSIERYFPLGGLFDRLDNKFGKGGFKIKQVIFNEPATIVIWEDGSKTVVKCGKDDVYDKEKGLALCFMKKALDNKGNYNNVLKEHTK